MDKKKNKKKKDNIKIEYEKLDKVKKNILIASISIIILLTLFSVLITVYNLSTEEPIDRYINDTKIYKVIYHENYVPGATYEITIYDNKVHIKTIHSCSALDCEDNIEEDIYNYSKENMAKLKQFLNNNFVFADKTVELEFDKLNKYQQRILQCIRDQYSFETAIEDYKYKIEYSENDNTYYNIFLKNNNKIIVKKMIINDNYEVTKLDSYNLNFSKNSINKLYEYAKDELEKNNKDDNIIYKYTTLRKDEKNILNSIINNDESYLTSDNEPKLSYTIEYHGIKCETPVLYLYDNNTYEYYYTFIINDDSKKPTPKTGTYNFDITKIIKNNKESEHNYYEIKDEKNNKDYSISDDNKELHNLLNSINAKLDMCLEREY